LPTLTGTVAETLTRHDRSRHHLALACNADWSPAASSAGRAGCAEVRLVPLRSRRRCCRAGRL